jgi:hypothetical protein
MKVISVLMIGWPLLAGALAIAAITWRLLGPPSPARGNGDARAPAATVLRLGYDAMLRRLRRPRPEHRPAPAPLAVRVATPPGGTRGPAKAAFRANSAAHRLSPAPAGSRRSRTVH